MKKTAPLVFIIIAIVEVIALTFNVKSNRNIDWEESFDEKSNTPYGVSVFYKELPNVFQNNKVRTVYHAPYNYLSANSEDGYGDHVAEGSFIIIGNSDYLYDESVNALLDFVDRGNTLFISDYYFESFEDTLGITIDYIKNERDSISHMSFEYEGLKGNAARIDKNEGDNFFSDYDTTNTTVLGYSKIDGNLVNFIEVPFGDGNIYLHLEPKVFTNYNLLKEERYKYVEGVLSYLPKKDIYFDSYSKIYTSYNGDVEQKSNLSWFLEQTAFKWAWYTALILTLLFMVFNAKRRQRIIKIIKPLQNTTVGFVKTISNLYFETQDHKNLIDKKVTYFLEKVRSDYNLDTSILDEEFIIKLASKSGKKKDQVKKLINFINWLRSKSEFFEENLIKLNKHIEDFYSK